MTTLREQLLLVIGEELLLGKLVFAGAGGDRPHRHHHDVVPPQIGLLQHGLQMRHVVVVAHRDQNAAGPRVHGVGGDIGAHVQIELFQAVFGVRLLACVLMCSEIVNMMKNAIVKPTP